MLREQIAHPEAGNALLIETVELAGQLANRLEPRAGGDPAQNLCERGRVDRAQRPPVGRAERDYTSRPRVVVRDQ